MSALGVPKLLTKKERISRCDPVFSYLKIRNHLQLAGGGSHQSKCHLNSLLSSWWRGSGLAYIALYQRWLLDHDVEVAIGRVVGSLTGLRSV